MRGVPARFEFDLVQLRAQVQARHAHASLSLNLVEQTGSTNSDLLQQARLGVLANGDENAAAALIARRQTAGRGRMQRAWQAAPGSALLMSVGACRRIPMTALQGLPVAVGGVVAAVLAGHGVNAWIKWPNDLVIGRAKLAGILVETVPLAAGRFGIVVGLGLNGLLPDAVLQQIGQDATDLSAHASRQIDTAALCVDLAVAIAGLLTAEDLPARIAQVLIHDVQPRDAVAGQQVRLIDPLRADAAPIAQGLALGLSADYASLGALQLQTDDGVQSIQSGEVSLRWG